MKTKRNVLSRTVAGATTLFALVCFTTVPSAFADFDYKQTYDAVSSFNALNDGLGYYYSVKPDNGRWTLTTVSGSDQADLSAYSPSTSAENMIKSICVEPNVGTQVRQYGQLNYENNTTTTKSGDALTLGAAYLYTNFATGMLDGYNFDSPNYADGSGLTKAIQALMGSNSASWTGNEFMAGLLDVNADKSFWQQVYDPGQYYDILGDYSVFVMNNHDAQGTKAQDMLYLVGYGNGGSSNVTPEPASILILGSGLAGLFWVRRRNRKNAQSI